jgi:hypothetical protein
MDLDVHGSGLAMVMLTLGLLIVLYADAIWTVANDVFEVIGPLESAIFAIVFIGAELLVGARLSS